MHCWHALYYYSEFGRPPTVTAFPFSPLSLTVPPLHAVALKYTLHAQQSNSVVSLVLLAYFSAFSLLFFPELSLFTDVGVLCPEYSDFIVI